MERNAKYSGNASSRRTKREQPRGGSGNTNYYGNSYGSTKARRYDSGYETQNNPFNHRGETSGYYGRSYKRNRRFNNDSSNYTHYGHDRDELYSRALGYELGYLREDEDYPTYSRYDERMNSKRGNYMYDNSTARNTGDYRYQNAGGRYSSRYNTFDDDRDYYQGFRVPIAIGINKGRRTGANYHNTYNAFNNDRGYEKELDESDSEHRNYERWRGRRIR